MQPDPAKPSPELESSDARSSSRSGKRHLVRLFAIVAYLAMLIGVPLAEKLALEKLYALTIVVASTLLALFSTARIAFAMLLPAVLFSTLTIASMLKFEYLLTPVLAPDLEYYINLQTLALIARYPVLLTACLVFTALVPLLLGPAWFWEAPWKPRGWSSIRTGITRALGTLASAALLGICLSPLGPFSGVFNKPMWATITDHSYVTAFFTSFSDTEVRLPSIPVQTKPAVNWTLDEPTPEPHDPPDVVVVLEESTFDPRMLDLCTIPVCDLPMFKADADTRAIGPLTVHSFGGGTWTAEFAFESGLSDELFGNAGMYAPYSLAPRIEYTLPRAFKAAGYRTIAVYSHSGDFLNARHAYANYGFDIFYDGTDIGLDWDSTDADLLRVFRQIYSDETEAHPHQPLFIFTLTLHQHGPHMDPLEELPPPYDKPLFKGRFKPASLDSWLNLNLGNYLYRVSLSSQMLDELQDLLWNSERSTVLMHFGDHQPSFDGAMHAIPKHAPKAAGPNVSRVTYYALKTSFPMRKMRNYETLDITYLGSLLLEAAGVPKNAFYQANALLRERCGGRYLTCRDSKLIGSYHDYVFNTLKDLRDE